jgi:hypothetical protein
MAWSEVEDREWVEIVGLLIADEHDHWDGSHGCENDEASRPGADGAAGLVEEASGQILKACPACPKISRTSKMVEAESDPRSGQSKSSARPET